MARAAERRFHLDEIHFIPHRTPPTQASRKNGFLRGPLRGLTSIACADHQGLYRRSRKRARGKSGREIFYSVDYRVRHFKQKHHAAGTHLYFLVGADSFLDIPTWKDYETLLGLCDFIVASRPGFNVNALRLVIPPELFGRKGVAHAPLDPRAITLRRTVVYVLDAVSSHVSATGSPRLRLDPKRIDSRACAAARRGIH